MALAAPSDDAVNCRLVVPADPLTAKGLATPYELLGPCHETDPGTAAFVQGTVLDPATGAVSVYDPLVVDRGKRPAVRPVEPKLPAGAVVGLWFGFNGDTLTLQGTGNSLAAGRCVNGLDKSTFGQYAYCNAPAFFAAADSAITAGTLKIPPLGTAADGRPCPTTRDFSLVDQDQSDNVTSTYLFLDNGLTAQNTSANEAALSGAGAKILANGSDNALLDDFVDPALGCTPYTAPDLAQPGHLETSLALNELQAARLQAAPAALVPPNDPMVLVNGKVSLDKTNLYRAGVGQPPVNAPAESGAAYCTDIVQVGPARLQLDEAFTKRGSSPDSAAATNLFTFLAQRLAGSFDDLGCAKLIKRPNPVKVRTDAAGVAIGATFTPPVTQAPTPPVVAQPPSQAATPTPTRTRAPSLRPSVSVSASASHGAAGAPTKSPAVAASPAAPVQQAAQPPVPPQPTAPITMRVPAPAGPATHPSHTAQPVEPTTPTESSAAPADPGAPGDSSSPVAFPSGGPSTVIGLHHPAPKSSSNGLTAPRTLLALSGGVLFLGTGIRVFQRVRRQEEPAHRPRAWTVDD
jgi:hypothetical protein